MAYPILDVDPESVIGDEQLGSKPKAWFLSDGKEWLFKEARPHTGEDWAEKIAAEVAARVTIEAATVELATCRDRNGSASRSFIDRTEKQNLVHGNELLAGQITGYDRNKRQRQSDHTLENIVATINKLFASNEHIKRGVLTTLASYMVLDALIGNTDRHHENWGLVLAYQSERGTMQLSVAPSFDHASSLGRELSDARRAELLTQGHVETYVRRGRGGIYLRSEDRHGANPVYLVEVAVRAYPAYFTPTLESLAEVPLETLYTVIDEVPTNRMSEAARDFARTMLSCTYRALMKAAE
jgi:HipA-like C-terminal domain